ncbi:hypothetical protein [Bradyrhizobium japonicum]|uniref:hypothetical protein n=1 Tax=Bradyrhizobium japonicum TaxID=375 RepID=UPI00040949D5|nr:hypothetical protein [Bradyrhizobium japonicum]
MPTRREILGSALFALLSNQSSAAEQTPAPLADLNFLDRRASEQHARALRGNLRYVDHEVFGDPAGIAIEEAALNGAEDAGFSSEAALPTGWQVMPIAGKDITFTRVAPALGRLQVRGEGAGQFFINMAASRHFAVKQGELLTGSLALRSVSREAGGLVKVELCIQQVKSDGSVASPVAVTIQLLQTDQPWWEQVRATATADGFAILALRVTTKARFDITFELHSPQLERRAWRSTFCATSRKDDDVTLTDPDRYLSHPERSVLLTADAPRFVASGALWCEYGDPDNYVEIQQRERVLYAKVVSKGSPSEVRLGIVPPLMRFTVCLAQDAKGLAASLNGKPLKTIDCEMPVGLKLARLGSGVSGSWNSTIAALTLFAGKVVNCAALSRPDKVFFDDFDRPDSPNLGVSPTGQVIRKTGAVGSAISGRKWVVAGVGVSFSNAAYGVVRLGRPPRYLGAVVNWTSGSPGGAAAMLAATDDDPRRSINALHAVLTDQKEIFQTMIANKVETALAEFVYPVPMARDGTTAYGVACLINYQERAVVYVGPQGDLARHVHPTYTERAGQLAIFEHYWQLTQCRPEFLAVAAG